MSTNSTAFTVTSFLSNLRTFLDDKQDLAVHNASLMGECLVIIAITVALFLLLRLVILRIAVPLVKKVHPKVASVIASISSPFSFLVLWLGLAISTDSFRLPGEQTFYINRIFYALAVLSLVRIFANGGKAILQLYANHRKKASPDVYSMDKLLIDLSLSLYRLFLWTIGVFFILQNIFEFNISQLLVSAGVLGLAVAFAAQNTIANVFGAFSILGSHLFKVGDWIRLDNDIEGRVEKIGFRSIRIRAFSGRVVDVPNRLIADSKLDNYSDRQYWREHFSFGLTYDTTPDQMEEAKRIIGEISRDMGDLLVPGLPARFNFTEFSACSLDLTGYIWVNAVDFFEMREARDRFNTEVLRRFNAAGLKFAFPTTTIDYTPRAPKNPQA